MASGQTIWLAVLATQPARITTGTAVGAAATVGAGTATLVGSGTAGLAVAATGALVAAAGLGVPAAGGLVGADGGLVASGPLVGAGGLVAGAHAATSAADPAKTPLRRNARREVLTTNLSQPPAPMLTTLQPSVAASPVEPALVSRLVTLMLCVCSSRRARGVRMCRFANSVRRNSCCAYSH